MAELPSLLEESEMESYYPGEYDYDDTWYYPDTDEPNEIAPTDLPAVPTETIRDNYIYDRLAAEEPEPEPDYDEPLHYPWDEEEDDE
ncbi:MAG TPA: hypothetical protein VFE08_14550 [Candidatus Sulfotelmatobacter sp.]|jgi:hypothetical protein|nr:hypothetical protein [Candidatus Sulfotelmatobacter sp.]